MSEADIPFAYDLFFQRSGPQGISFSGEGTAFFTEETLELKALSGKGMPIAYREIAAIESGDYRLSLTLASHDRIDISQLGYHYEDFVSKLTKYRNELTKEDLLMHEKLLFTAEEIQYSHIDAEHKLLSSGPCEAQITETALIIAMPDTRHLKFPLSYVQHIGDIDYTLVISMEYGERVMLSMLGRQREPLTLNIEKAIKKLEEEAHTLCSELFSESGKGLIGTIAPMFKDGRAVTKAALDKVDPCLWQSMKGRLLSCGISYSYEALCAIGNEDACTMGIKRGLMGELTGEYVWFMMPLKDKPILALEAGMTNGSGGQATYFFRLPEVAQTTQDLNAWMQKINYSLYMVNFRREPIYLTDEQLGKPAYASYRFAVEKLPALQLLRKLFVGRVLHTSESNWKKAVDAILNENL